MKQRLTKGQREVLSVLKKGGTLTQKRDGSYMVGFAGDSRLNASNGAIGFLFREGYINESTKSLTTKGFESATVKPSAITCPEGKVTFISLEDAHKRIAEIRKNPTSQHRHKKITGAYKCKTCKLFHLTSRSYKPIGFEEDFEPLESIQKIGNVKVKKVKPKRW